jgi:hypothetical protein
MNALTPEQYQQLLNKYLIYANQQIHKNISYHSAGIEYTSLMMSFLMFNLSACESLLKLATSFGNKWYPVSVGYIVDRSIFEVLINARYISKEPKTRSKQYIEYDKIIKKKKLDNFRKHRGTNDSSWHEFINSALVYELEPRMETTEDEYKKVESQYMHSRNGRKIPFENWAGKKIRDMAIEVNHEIEYDLLYSELSSFVHTNVRLADQFLRNDTLGLYWSQRPSEFHLGNVFRCATTFFSCFLGLFGNEFGIWSEQDLRKVVEDT